jgi:ethanolamine kinase
VQLVFAHCDLLSGNVIVEPKDQRGDRCQEGDEEDESVNFIDYEYATPSPAAFDLSNHFAEWGGFDCDYNAMPTKAQRLEFVREYIHTYFDLLPASENENTQSPTTTARGQESKGEENGNSQHAKPSVNKEAEVARMLEEVDTFRGLPGFYWGIWSLVQAQISEIDFDYASYAEVRLGEYWAWRDELTGARAARGDEMPLRERRWAQES